MLPPQGATAGNTGPGQQSPRVVMVEQHQRLVQQGDRKLFNEEEYARLISLSGHAGKVRREQLP